ncbi:ABC transporter permease [Kitasatospora cystarginea]|uniref:ABC transporter permease n=1 Tax=Kitasatospora cystarginea TaxID=58350 RepID=A0ABP5QC81_9ACTN
MTPRALLTLALGDFRYRARRPAYAMTLLAAVGLGALAVPAVGTRWSVLNLGDYRGVYNSAYVGWSTALAGALWLTLAGFYVVRGAVARDESTGVGRLLATTPLRSTAYLAAKFLGNLAVLGSMAAALAGTALVLQLTRGESTDVDPVALLTPYLLVTLPLLAVTAGAALLVETVPGLRGGLGNALWFFVALAVALGGQSPTAPLGGLGVRPFVASMRDALVARNVDLSDAEFSLGLTSRAHPLQTVQWNGMGVDPTFAADRLLLVLGAVLLALLPAFWFHRFDPSRGAAPLRLTDPAPEPLAAPVPHRPAPPYTALTPLPQAAVVPGRTFGRLLAGEVRILLQGLPRWCWLLLAALVLPALVLPYPAGTRGVLLLAWLLPLLLWSRLGTQREEYGVDTLLGAYPAPRGRVLAEWAAGVVLSALTGAGPAVRIVLAADWPMLASWVGGALFVPALGLALGLVSRSHRLFQMLYPPLWYLVLNGTAALDFMGVVRRHGHLAGPGPLAVTALTAALLAVALVADPARRTVRR